MRTKYLFEVSGNEIKNIINYIKTKNSLGAYGMTIIKFCMASDFIREELQQAKITHIFKKGGKNEANNYGPQFLKW